MNILDFDTIILKKIFSYLNLKSLNYTSRVCKDFNLICKKQKSKDQKFDLENIFGLNLIFNYFPKVNLNNYKVICESWKNIIFNLALRNNKEREILKEKNPPNVLISIENIDFLEIEDIDKNIKYLDCPLNVINSTPNISDNLVYLNLSESLYIIPSLDFSSKSLIYLDLSFTDLINVNLNFSKNLKVVNLQGVINLYSLKGFEYVENLNLDYSEMITDLSPLKSIKKLSLRYSKGIEIIPYLEHLNYLDISFSEVKDISKLKNLKKIYLQDLQDVEVLGDFDFLL